MEGLDMKKNKLVSSDKNISQGYMDCDKLKTFKMGFNTKSPQSSGEWGGNNKHKWRVRSMDFLTKEIDPSKNFAIPTGKDNDIIVVDLDFYTKESDETPFSKEDSEFCKKFPDYLKTDTLICETGSGGHHLFFQFDPKLKQTANDPHRIDIRSGGGLVVAPGSVVNGKEYKILNYQNISKIPTDMKEWLIDNLYTHSKTKKKPINPKVKVFNEENDEEEEHNLQDIDMSVYDICMTDTQLKGIIKGLPNSYFNTYQGYLIFTTAMKSLNRYDLWEKHPKTNNPVDGSITSKGHIEWMNSCWSGIKNHHYILCFNNLLKNTTYPNARTMLDYYKMKPELKNTRKPDLTINRPKLGYNFFKELRNGKLIVVDLGNGRKVVFIKSDTGTGKTTSVKHEIKDNNLKFISIVSRTSLGREQETIFKEHGIENVYFHSDITDKIKKEGWNPCDNNWGSYEGKNIVINIDSLLKLSSWSDFSGYVLYLDEVNSMIEYLVCADLPTLSGQRRSIMDMFKKMLNECDIVYGTDADINDITFLRMKQLGFDPYFINNIHKHNKGTKASEIFSYGEFIKQLNRLDKWIVCCDSKSMAEVISNVSGTIGTDETSDILLITGDTKETYNLDDWDKVIYSPKIIYGLDSVMRRHVFCYYKEQTISPKQMVQQVNRCRDIIELRYLFTCKSCCNYKYHSYEDVKDEIVDNDLYGCNTFKLSEEIGMYDDYLEVLAMYKYNQDCYNTNKFAHFIKILTERGFTIDSVFFQTSIKGLKKDKDELEEEQERKFLKCVDTYKPIVKEHRDKCETDLISLYNNYREKNPTMDHYYKEKSVYTIDKMRREENINIEKYFDDKTQTIQEYLRLPMDTLDKHMDLYRKQTPLETHFSICKFFTSEQGDIYNKLRDSMDYNVKKTTCKSMKFIFLESLRDMMCSNPLDKCNMEVGRPLTSEESKKINKEYKNIFSTRKNDDVDYTDINNCKQLIGEIYKNLFGKDFLIKKRVRIDGVRQTIYELNTEEYDYHMDVLSYRTKSEKFEDIYREKYGTLCWVED